MKHLTKKERQRIEKLIMDCHSLSTIASIIGRSRNCVITEVRRAGGRINYNADIAHEKRQESKFASVNKGTKKSQSNDLKFQALSMQIELLTQLYKELHDKYQRDN
jgi:IS30 family transposase